jgi:predicted dehydrogenase
MPEKIDIAVVGCGMLAKDQHLPNIKNNSRLNLKWCCDLNDEILRDVNKKFHPDKCTKKAEDVARDPDTQFVVIATHHNVRRQLIELFAKAGKHIFAEKPLASDMKETTEIYQLLRKTGTGFCLGHNRRSAPAIKQARQIYLNHKLNKVNPKWRYDREGLGGPDSDWDKRTLVLLRVNDDALSWKKWAFEDGTLFVEMTHFVDLAFYLTDLKPAYVTTVGDKTTNWSVNSINIEFEDGSLGVIASTVNGSFGYPKELIEIFYGGAAIVVEHCVELRVAGIESEPFWRTYPLQKDDYSHIHIDGGIRDYYRKTLALYQEITDGKKAPSPPPWPNKGHYDMLDDFVTEVLAQRKGPCPIEDAVVTTELILKAVRSAKNNGTKEKIELDILKGQRA